MAVPSTVEAQKNGIVKALDPQEGAYRLEIDEFVSYNPERLNLFLLALEEMQKNNDLNPWKDLKPGQEPTPEALEKYWWSWYSIGGIHGWPKEEWGHKHPPVPKTMGYGYCRHSSELFPTWHRPYVMMMEQAVFNKMYEIAGRFEKPSTKRKYLEAVKLFRFPYWDPWMPRNTANTDRNWAGLFGVPAILRAQEVFVRRPDDHDTLQSMDNPLYQYKVPQVNEVRKEAKISWQNLGAPKAIDQTTMRTPSGIKSTRNNEIFLDKKLRSQAFSENSKFVQLLSNLGKYKHGWDDFAKRSKEGVEVSLESWHDAFHNLLGFGRGTAGNMSFGEVAGFDPIFWLHHCNIDRILALFQSLNPNIWVPELSNTKEALRPFFKGPGKEEFWTSKDTRDWTQCGFAVPGIKKPDNEVELKKTVQAYLNATYFWISTKEAPPAALLQLFPKDMDLVEAIVGVPVRESTWTPIQAVALQGKRMFSMVTRTLTSNQSTQHPPEKDSVAAKDIESIDESAFPKGALESKGLQRTWNVHLTVRKFAFNGSFNVDFFIGPVDDEDPAAFMAMNNQVGFSGIFTSGSEAECPNCDKQRVEDLRVTDVVPLTTALVSYLQSNDWPSGPRRSSRTLQSLEVEDVIKFLKERLEWRITTVDSVNQTEKEVIRSGLQVLVMDRMYTLPTTDHPMGSYGESMPHPEITAGKAGGSPA